ncbi:hypothetical protein STPH2_3024 [Streptomyces sp. KO7888]|nr:hypothetical protein [Streptomyces sp. KO7888]
MPQPVAAAPMSSAAAHFVARVRLVITPPVVRFPVPRGGEAMTTLAALGGVRYLKSCRVRFPHRSQARPRRCPPERPEGPGAGVPHGAGALFVVSPRPGQGCRQAQVFGPMIPSSAMRHRTCMMVTAVSVTSPKIPSMSTAE